MQDLRHYLKGQSHTLSFKVMESCMHGNSVMHGRILELHGTIVEHMERAQTVRHLVLKNFYFSFLLREANDRIVFIINIIKMNLIN